MRTKFYVEGNPLARALIFSKARKAVLAQTHGHYPAPLEAIEVMRYAMAAGVERGMARELERAVTLVDSDVARNLVRLFFLMEASKKDPFPAKAARVAAGRRSGGGSDGGRHRPDRRRQDRRRRPDAGHQLERHRRRDEGRGQGLEAKGGAKANDAG